MERIKPAEVGQAFQEQVAQLTATNEAINTTIQENSKKIKAAETELKDYRNLLRRVRKKGEEVEARVNECRAKEEKCEDGWSQLESKVGKVLEGNQALKVQIEGVGRQVQHLQQSLHQALHQEIK